MYVRTGKAPEVKEPDARLALEEGAFVTIYKQGNLAAALAISLDAARFIRLSGRWLFPLPRGIRVFSPFPRTNLRR